jgi:hypothetical protein
MWERGHPARIMWERGHPACIIRERGHPARILPILYILQFRDRLIL